MRTRLHRARRLLREALGEQLASALKDAFHLKGHVVTGLSNGLLNQVGLMPALAP